MTSVEAIIDRQFLIWEQLKAQPREDERPLCIITVSRQTGSRGSYFATELARRLDRTRMNREIIDAICASAEYRERMIEMLHEQCRSDLDTLVGDLLTRQAVDRSDCFRHLCRVVFSMAQLGGVVLLGRGSGFILGPRRGFHIRTVAPMPRRIDNLVAYKNVTADEAEQAIEQSDVGRREYIRQKFGADIDDPCHYDLVFNTAHLDVEEMVVATIRTCTGKLNKLTRQAREGQ